MSERHVFILPGISREAFTDVGIQATMNDEDLNYYVHDHKHSPYGDIDCNERCTLIRGGQVMTNSVAVTLSDHASEG